MSASTPYVSALRRTCEDDRRRKGRKEWRDLKGRTTLDLDVESLSDPSLHAQVAGRSLPDVRITFASKAELSSGSPRAVLADRVDDLALYICTDGQWAIAQRNREAPLFAGEAGLVSKAEAASAACTSPACCIRIQIAQSPLAPLSPHLGDALMRPIPHDDEALQLLIGYVRALGASRPLRTSALRTLVASQVRDLVAATLRSAADRARLAASGGVRAARLRAVKEDIERHIEEPGLSVCAVAARHGITPRYVQVLFEDEAMTFSGFVLARRLARAHDLLANPQHRSRRIADIAYGVGFGDLSHFNRAFRRQYGATPSLVRAQALAGRTAPLPRS